MGIKTVYVCDRCGTESEDASKWFKVGISPLIGEQQLIVKPFDKLSSSVKYEHFCGEYCVSRYISLHLNELLIGGEAASEPQCVVFPPPPACEHGISMIQRCKECEKDANYRPNQPSYKEPFQDMNEFVNSVVGFIPSRKGAETNE